MTPLLPRALAGAVLDMDGVVTNTRVLHLRAWTMLFDAELPELAPAAPPFTPRDYATSVDGRSRESGVRTLLAAKGVGADAITGRLVERLASRKQQLFENLVATQGVALEPGAARFIRSLRDAGVRVAIATASKNANRVLEPTGVLSLVDALVDGNDAEALGLPSKPDPALFVEACRRIGVAPEEALLVEDSEAGVTAAVAAGFAVVVGRAAEPAHAAGLRRREADLIVPDLTALGAEPPGLILARDGGDPWLLRFTGYDPAAERTRESLCTLANTYWATRGAAEEARRDSLHRPGTYLAGVYDSGEGGSHADEALVNAPNWLPLLFRPEGGDWLRAEDASPASFHQEFDLRQGLLTRSFTVRDERGRETSLRFRRIVSQADRRIGAVQAVITARNWSGRLAVRTGVDAGADRTHLTVRDLRAVAEDTLLCESETVASGVHIALVARTRAYRGSALLGVSPESVTDDSSIAQEFDIELEKGRPLTVEKVVAVSTSRDRAIRSPEAAARAAAGRAPRFAEILEEHARAWEELWSVFDVTTEPEGPLGVALALNTMHLLQTLAGADPDLDVGVPARGLHGEAYGGHVFWDELFVYPVLTLRRPGLTRELLRYRHRRLPQARLAAAAAGLAGALFPWQSATTGEDVTPDRLFNPLAGAWMPDHSHLQRHVGLGVAYSAWQFYQTTGDAEYLAEEGGELIVEIARCFASAAEWDEATGNYSIRGVMGPDEFHDGPPDAAGRGLTDNVYTNVMTAWVLLRAADTVRLLSARPDTGCYDALRISPGELDEWARIARRLRIVFNADGTLSQFDGYDRLEQLDLDAYRARYPNIQRMDLILDAEGDSTNRYQVSKQPDCLMLLYLFSAEELRELLAHLGHALDPDVIVRTVERYSRTSTYGSTLSNVVHSWLEARRDRERSWRFLERTLQSDLADIQGGTTRDGIHLAAMAGSVDLLTRCYAGLETRADMLWFHPLLPSELERLEFGVLYRSHRLRLVVTHSSLEIRSAPGYADPVRIMVEGQPALLHTGEARTFEL